MLSPLQALRMAFELYRLDPSHLESYQGFTERFHARNPASHYTERQIRESYDLWRRGVIKFEIERDFRRARARDVAVYLLKDRGRQITVAAMVLLVLAVLFPPHYLVIGDTTLTLGLAFAFDRHAGRVDALFLVCEMAAIVGLWWLAQRGVVTSSDEPQAGSVDGNAGSSPR